MSVYIVAEDETISSRIRSVLNFHKADCPSSHVLPIDQAAPRLSGDGNIELIVVALPTDRERGLESLPALAQAAPGRLLVVGPTSDSRLVLNALRRGGDDYVDSADLEVELDAALARLASASAAKAATPGRLVAVLGPNGGSGSSTIAANVAASLAGGGQSVCLIDMKLESGDLAALLDLRPSFTLADLCKNAGRLDKAMFERSLVAHDSGVRLLAAPASPADARLVRPEGVAQALGIARMASPLIIADLDHSFREEQAVVLKQSDAVLIVFRLDFASLRNVNRTLEYLNALSISRDAVRLVVNRSGQLGEVPASKAEEALNGKIAHFVADDPKTVNRANNLGVPVVIEAPKTKVAQNLVTLARSVGERRSSKGVGSRAWRPWRKSARAAL